MLGNKIKSSEQGFSLIEVIVGVAILAALGVALLSSLTLATRVAMSTNTMETARDLAQAQMEYVQSQAYNDDNPEDYEGEDYEGPAFYDTLPDLENDYPGYYVKISASRIDKGNGIETDTGFQEITIIVYQGTEEQFTLVGRKADW